MSRSAGSTLDADSRQRRTTLSQASDRRSHRPLQNTRTSKPQGPQHPRSRAIIGTVSSPGKLRKICALVPRAWGVCNPIVGPDWEGACGHRESFLGVNSGRVTPLDGFIGLTSSSYSSAVVIFPFAPRRRLRSPTRSHSRSNTTTFIRLT